MAQTQSYMRNMFLGAIAALSIFTGVAVSYLAVHAPPKSDFDSYSGQVLSALRKEFGLVPHGRFFASDSPAVLELEKFYMVIVRIFKDLTLTTFGKGAFLFISSMVGPIVTFAEVESVKPHASIVMGGIAVTLIFFLGQLICIGAALPIVYIPAVALVRALRPRETFPQRAFAKSAFPLFQLLQVLTGAPVLLTTLVPTDHKYFFLANTLFQFFPAAFVFLSFYKLCASKAPSVSSRDVANLYREGRVSTTVLYWISLYFMGPTLLRLAQGSWVPFSDAVNLILWDALGVFMAFIFLVAIDLVADPVPAGAVSRSNVHATGQSLVVGTLKGALVSLVFGPGTAFNNYLAAREEAVAPVHPGYEVVVEAKAQ